MKMRKRFLLQYRKMSTYTGNRYDTNFRLHDSKTNYNTSKVIETEKCDDGKSQMNFSSNFI